nr:GAF domain-containing protein [Bacteroidota bacterium]
AQGNVIVPTSSADLLYIFSCITILNGYYKADVSLSPNLFFNIPDKHTGILRHYRTFVNADFNEIIPGPHVKKLTQKEIFELTDNFENVELWKKKIPPNSLSFEGFALLTLFDVTKDEAISALKFDLLKKDDRAQVFAKSCH